jgi:hypothetical protein
MPDPDPLAHLAARSAAALAAHVDSAGSGRLSAAFPADVRAWELLARVVETGRAYGRAVAAADEHDQTPSEPDMLYAIGLVPPPDSTGLRYFLTSSGGCTTDVGQSRKHTTAADAAAALADFARTGGIPEDKLEVIELSRKVSQFDLLSPAPTSVLAGPAANGHVPAPAVGRGG